MEKSIHNTDEIIRATGADGYLKMAVITAKHTVQRAREIHNTSPVASAALGRTLCAASLLGNAMKEENGTLTIRIAGEDYPYNLVKSKFLKLNSTHLEYVIGCMKNNTTKVSNIKAYLTTALYNAPNTINHYYTAEVNHDMYGTM